MKYDPAFRTAIFLGPSFPKLEAEKELAGNYYPPASFGDVYRLIGTNVEMILILDGYFHSRASIWPREILAALHAGIAVIGAASLGAIRAAELSHKGMVGVGRIFESFASRELVGDDEVALLHTDEESGYRAISDPLVEFRAALAQAVDLGFIEPSENAELIKDLGLLYFGERTREQLFRTPAFAALPTTRSRQLRSHLETVEFEAKRNDAREALRFCVRHRETLVRKASRRGGAGLQGVAELAQRGIPSRGGELQPLQDLLGSQPYRGENMPKIIREVRRRFLILNGMQEQGLAPPVEDLVRQPSYRDAARRAGQELETWLQANAMREAEFAAERDRRARCEWLEDFSGAHEGPTNQRDGRLSGGDRFLLKWAEHAGIRPPAEIRTAPQATVDWILQMGPGHFGLAGHEDPYYNEDLALIRDFQFRGWIAQWSGSRA